MRYKLPRIVLALVLAVGMVGCSTYGASAPFTPFSPSRVPQSGALPTPTLWVFRESSGFSTTDLRDVQEQIVQFNTANELIWTADGTHLPGYRVESHNFGTRPVFFISGAICAEGCAFEVRFGTRDGERRAYLTADYGHDNPGTLVDVEVAGGALVATRTDVFPPGTFTLSGVVTEETQTGSAPLEGVSVYRGMTGGWQGSTTDKKGFYTILGMYDGIGEVSVSKEGYGTERRPVSINGDTRFDIQLVRR